MSAELAELESAATDLLTNGTAPRFMPPPGVAIQQVRTPYATALAVQKPRDIHDVARRLKQEADLAGEGFFYGWGAGKNHVEGPSVKMAMAAARCWGNCAVVHEEVQETAESWIFTATFVDLETGYNHSRPFRQAKKWVVFGQMDELRKDDMRFQIGASKAARNVILNVLPESLIDMALTAAKAGSKAKLEAFIAKNGIAKAADLVLKGLLKAGISEQRALAKVGIADVKALNVDNIVLLRGDLSAIESGEARADELFPVSSSEKLAEDVKTKKGKKPAPVSPEPAAPPVSPAPELTPAERASTPATPEQLATIERLRPDVNPEYLTEWHQSQGHDPAKLTIAQANATIAMIEGIETTF